MSALTLPAARRRDKVVILTGLRYGAQFSTNNLPGAGEMISRSIRGAWRRLRPLCAPRRIIRAVFSLRASAAVTLLAVAAMWWHNVTISDTLAAQRAAGLDCFLALPWLAVWAWRTTRSSDIEEGGEA